MAIERRKAMKKNVKMKRKWSKYVAEIFSFIQMKQWHQQKLKWIHFAGCYQ